MNHLSLATRSKLCFLVRFWFKTNSTHFCLSSKPPVFIDGLILHCCFFVHNKTFTLLFWFIAGVLVRNQPGTLSLVHSAVFVHTHRTHAALPPAVHTVVELEHILILIIVLKVSWINISVSHFSQVQSFHFNRSFSMSMQSVSMEHVVDAERCFFFEEHSVYSLSKRYTKD